MLVRTSVTKGMTGGFRPRILASMAKPKQPQRTTTGVPGLDNILQGGIPTGQMYLIEGDPGTGKTTLAMQFMIEGVERGGTSLYLTLSEPTTELKATAASHGWSLDAVEIVEFVPDEATLAPDGQYTVFHPSEVELATTIQRLIAEVDRLKPDRLVIDSLSELRLLASDAIRYRRQLLALKHYFAGRKTTVLLLDDQTRDQSDMQLQSIAHGVIRMEKLPRSYGVTRRRIEIVKMRGSAFREGYHDYTLREGGVVVYPRLVAGEHESWFLGQDVTSGVRELDLILGGGIPRGSSTLVTGPTGIGKSTICMQFAIAAATRGDRAIVYAFDEVLQTAKQRATSMGMEIEGPIERGMLSMTQVNPAELSPGEFIWQIRNDVEERDARVVVIDSLNGLLYSMPGELDLILHLHELLAFLSQKGVVTLLVMTQKGVVGSMSSDLNVSYLADTVLLMRYFEAAGEIRQTLSVLKKRLGSHERTLREFWFGKGGIKVGEPLTRFRGVLTGVPELTGEAAGNGRGRRVLAGDDDLG